MTELKQTIDPQVDVKKLFSLAFSVGGVQAMIAVVGILTIKIIAPLGSDVLAGVTAGQRLYFIIQAVLLGLNVGSLALISRSHGEKDHKQTNAWIRLSLLITVITTIIFGVIFWSIPEFLLQSLGMEGEALTEGVSYIQVLAYCGWLIGFYFILAGALRACGIVKTPLLSGILLNVGTLFITYVFVEYNINPVSHWSGSLALAAILGNVLGLVFMMYLSRSRLQEMFVGKWTFKNTRGLLKVSSPAIFEQVLRQVAVLAFLWVVAKYGTAPFAAYGASVMLITVSLVVGFGLSMATAVMVGQAIGAGTVNLAKQVLRTSLITSVIFMSAIGLVIGIFAQEISIWMVGEGEVAYYTSVLVLFYAIIQPVMAVDFVLTGALQGSGDTRWPMLSVMLGNVIIRFSTAMVLLHFDAPVEWIFATVFIDYLVKTGLLVWRVYGCNWLKEYDV
ncbi:MATE family efflux transporter [Pseudocolwellia agarivorans]|uniref:MATE family efflux transporter n=1 Tax=Pseudocolwellia agarivorans TaxID=1911682 RepID=UPI003F8853E1